MAGCESTAPFSRLPFTISRAPRANSQQKPIRFVFLFEQTRRSRPYTVPIADTLQTHTTVIGGYRREDSLAPLFGRIAILTQVLTEQL